MKSSVDKVVDELKVIQTELYAFLNDYSFITRKIHPHDIFFSASGNYGFEPLREGGISQQNTLFRKVNRLFENIEVLLLDSPAHYKENYNSSKNAIISAIEQRNYTFSESIIDLIKNTDVNFNTIMEMFTNVFKVTGEIILIPDTNALYAHPLVEQWEFSSFSKFKIIITPSVLSDLDRHKIDHRNEEIRKKALKIINQIKEFRRRGSLLEGVSIRANKIELAVIAKEADFRKSLTWLDPSNDDDRLIAETVEIIRDNAGSVVSLVTADINLQNKCEMADLHFIEPPSPSGAT